VGNIYASESLFPRRHPPKRRPQSFSMNAAIVWCGRYGKRSARPATRRQPLRDFVGSDAIRNMFNRIYYAYGEAANPAPVRPDHPLCDRPARDLLLPRCQR